MSDDIGTTQPWTCDEEARKAFTGLQDRVDRQSIVLFGDKEMNVAGLVIDHSEVKEMLQDMIKKDRERIVLMRGIVVGLGLTTLTGAGTLVTLLVQIFSGGGP
jgi:hypothetical protein